MAHYVLDSDHSSVTLNLRSQDATITDDDSLRCLWLMRTPLVAPEGHAMLLSLDRAVVPHSFYNLNANNNQLWFRIHTYSTSDGTVASSSSPLLTSLTPGQMWGDQLSSRVQSEVRATLTANGHSSVQPTVSFNYGQGALTFSLATTDKSIEFLLGSPYTNTPWRLLGLKQESSFVYGPKTFGSVAKQDLVSPNVVDLSGNVLELAVQCNLSYHASYSSKGTYTSNLAHIPVDAGWGQQIFYKNETGFRTRLYDRQLSSIDITIEDQAHRKVDLQGLSFSLTLRVDFIKVESASEALLRLKRNEIDASSSSMLQDRLQRITSFYQSYKAAFPQMVKRYMKAKPLLP